MDTLGKQLSAYSLTVIGLIMALGCWQGRNVFEMFNVGVSLAVAAKQEFPKQENPIFFSLVKSCRPQPEQVCDLDAGWLTGLGSWLW